MILILGGEEGEYYFPLHTHRDVESYEGVLGIKTKAVSSAVMNERLELESCTH